VTRRLEGMTAVVTGASSGNGRSIATIFAAEGAAVVCADLRREPLPGNYDEEANLSTDELIVTRGGRAVFVETNVINLEQVERAVSTAVKTFGRLDIMVNNAGVFTGSKPIIEETEQDWDFTVGVNAKGTWAGCKFAIAQMMKQDVGPYEQRGRVINLSSIGGVVGLRNEASYCASKGAVANLTRALALEYGKERIAVNALAPGMVATAMGRPFIEDPAVGAIIQAGTPFYRLGVASDVGYAALFLASAESSWVNGVVLPVDGGFTAQ
jgi:NAD(P)-dependent dehydrogenase (short-subunit alcohol dehydrogenase family)